MAAHGKHVLCEKPFSLTLEVADRMIEANYGAGVRVYDHPGLRFWPEYIKIKELCDQGVPARSMRSMPVVWRNSRIGAIGFRMSKKAAARCSILHLHDIDYLRYLLGPVRSVWRRRQQDQNGAWNHDVCLELCQWSQGRCRGQ